MKYWFIFSGGDIILQEDVEGHLSIPCCEEMPFGDSDDIIPMASMNGLESKAVELKESDDFDIPHFVKMGLRTSFYHLDTESYLMAGKAAELLNWHAGTHFCGYCGGKMEFHTDISKVCCRCHREIWPKLSPAIIVLIRRKDEILLVQSNTFKSDYYGLVAGFVETGESFEDCVHREVREETGLEITNLHYFGSQPWPYPRNIMAGFEADYLKGELQLQLSELNKAGWFRLYNHPRIPGKLSMARKLIDHWIAEQQHLEN